MNRRRLQVCLLVLLLLCASPLIAQETRIVRALSTDTAIRVDGLLDEAAWTQAGVITEMLQKDPPEGEPASQRTQIRVVYSQKSISDVDERTRHRSMESIIDRQGHPLLGFLTRVAAPPPCSRAALARVRVRRTVTFARTRTRAGSRATTCLILRFTKIFSQPRTGSFKPLHDR